jgi:putative intracellular protease/amidase
MLSFSSAQALAQTKGKFLILVANGEKEAPGKVILSRSTLWESAPAYHIFKVHGYDADFVSPAGGRIVWAMDEDTVDPTPMVHYAIRYEGFREKADQSRIPEKINPKEYKGIFIGGGDGPVTKLAKDPRFQKIIAEVYENNGVIGTCGHGAGALPYVKLRQNKYLVEGRKITGFPNESEKKSKWSDGGKLLPFLIEDALRANGGIFQSKADLKNKFDVVKDQRLITAMFMGSCAAVAKELIEAAEAVK